VEKRVRKAEKKSARKARKEEKAIIKMVRKEEKVTIKTARKEEKVIIKMVRKEEKVTIKMVRKKVMVTKRVRKQLKAMLARKEMKIEQQKISQSYKRTRNIGTDSLKITNLNQCHKKMLFFLHNLVNYSLNNKLSVVSK
jgi:hypothetical protein